MSAFDLSCSCVKGARSAAKRTLYSAERRYAGKWLMTKQFSALAIGTKRGKQDALNRTFQLCTNRTLQLCANNINKYLSLKIWILLQTSAPMSFVNFHQRRSFCRANLFCHRATRAKNAARRWIGRTWNIAF